MTGIIEWGQKSKPNKSLDQNLTPQKSNDDFPSHKNFQKASNDTVKFRKKAPSMYKPPDPVTQKTLR